MPDETGTAWQELQGLVAGLLDAWCERRAFGPLRVLLPAWPMPMGLTDDWEDLRGALRHVRASQKESLTEDEMARVGRAIALVDRALRNR